MFITTKNAIYSDKLFKKSQKKTKKTMNLNMMIQIHVNSVQIL